MVKLVLKPVFLNLYAGRFNEKIYSSVYIISVLNTFQNCKLTIRLSPTLYFERQSLSDYNHRILQPVDMATSPLFIHRLLINIENVMLI